MTRIIHVPNSTSFGTIKRWLDGTGLMNWKIDGFSGVAGGGGATDADLDAATALVLAFRQWSDQTYLAATARVNSDGYYHKILQMLTMLLM